MNQCNVPEMLRERMSFSYQSAITRSPCESREIIDESYDSEEPGPIATMVEAESHPPVWFIDPKT